MADFKVLYLHLFSRMSEAIEILQEAQREAERLYVQSGEAVPFPGPLPEKD